MMYTNVSTLLLYYCSHLAGPGAPGQHEAAELAVVLLLRGVQDLGVEPVPGHQHPALAIIHAEPANIIVLTICDIREKTYFVVPSS